MKYSDIKLVKQFCETLHSNPDWREVVKNIEERNIDFEVDNVRFINDADIMEILENELSYNEYMLGSFAPWAIAKATDWPQFLIELAQDAGKAEELGEHMTGEHVSELAQILVCCDGYGHHFNSYDSGEEEFTIDGLFFHVFDNR